MKCIIFITIGLILLSTATASALQGKSTVIHEGDIYSLQWSLNNSMIALQGAGGTWIYSSAGALVQHLEEDSFVEWEGGGIAPDEYSNSWGIGVSWSPDGKYLATPSFRLTHEGTIRIKIWNMIDLSVEKLLLLGFDNPSLDWSSDGEYIASAARGYDNVVENWVWNVKVWDLDKQIDVFNPHFIQSETPIHDLDWFSEADILAVGYADGTLRIVNFVPPNTISDNDSSIYQLADTSIISIAWHPTQQLVACGTRESILAWDVKSEEIVYSLTSNDFFAKALDWNSDGTLLASAGEDAIVRIWDVETGEVIATFERHEDEIIDLDWSPDDQFIATTSLDDTVRIWEVDLSVGD